MKQMQLQRKAVREAAAVVAAATAAVDTISSGCRSAAFADCMHDACGPATTGPVSVAASSHAAFIWTFRLFVCPASAAAAAPTPATTALSFAASESESEPHPACQFVVCIVCSFAHSMPLLLLCSAAAPLFVCFLKLQSFYTLHHGKHDPYFWQAAERALPLSLAQSASRCCSGCLKKLIWLRIFH